MTLLQLCALVAAKPMVACVHGFRIQRRAAAPRPCVQIEKLRADRAAFTPDKRFSAAVDLVRRGEFGWQDYLSPLMDSVTLPDHYLVANDFPAYLEAQART